MSKVSVVYKAPPGDAEVIDFGGTKFFNGKAVEIDDNEANAEILKNLRANKFFEIDGKSLFKASGPAAAGQQKSGEKAEPPEVKDDDDKDKAKNKFR